MSPVMVATLKLPVEKATFDAALSTISSKLETRLLEPTVFEIRFPPNTLVHPRIGAIGRAVLEHVLVPLHHDTGVVRVVMGQALR